MVDLDLGSPSASELPQQDCGASQNHVNQGQLDHPEFTPDLDLGHRALSAAPVAPPEGAGVARRQVLLPVSALRPAAGAHEAAVERPVLRGVQASGASEHVRTSELNQSRRMRHVKIQPALEGPVVGHERVSGRQPDVRTEVPHCDLLALMLNIALLRRYFVCMKLKESA